MPPHFFERELLASRRGVFESEKIPDSTDFLGDAIKNGELIIQCLKSSSDKRSLMRFIHRGDGNIFDQGQNLNINLDKISKDTKLVYQFLRENGASHFQDIENGTNLSPMKINAVLQKTVQSGLVTTDNYDSFLSIIGTAQKQKSQSRGRSSRHAIRENVKNQILLKKGRWFLTSSFAVIGKKHPLNEQIERQARLLLQRYGILVKEFYRRETGFLPWYQLFQVLKRLEWQGEIRRGYFIEGLSGIQYALPEAVEILSRLPDKIIDNESYTISTLDPSLPFGGNIDWSICKENGEKIEIKKNLGNHLTFLSEEPVLYSENYANRIWTLTLLKNKELERIFSFFKNWLRLPDTMRPKKKIEIETINDKAATDFVHADLFYKLGFEKEGSVIALWPSGL
jgi:ATP-dependent Lhr-like helicase